MSIQSVHSTHRLEIERDGLDEVLDLLIRKISALRKERHLAIDPEARFSLDERIKALEVERNKLERELNHIENKLQAEQGQISLIGLHNALLNLGFREQYLQFEQVSNDNIRGAFFIYGPTQDYGQRWLLNRLIFEFVRNITCGKKITIDLDRRSQKNDIRHIWREIGQQDLGLGLDCTPPEIAKKIYQLCLTQDVVLIFRNVDGTIEENLRNLLQYFWTPIVEIFLDRADYEPSDYRLYLFLLDNDGTVLNWGIQFQNKFTNNWDTKVPFELPMIEAFSKEEIDDWLLYQRLYLPEKLVALNRKIAVDEIYQYERGIPVPTLMKICDMCGFSFSLQGKEWMPH